MASRSIYSHRLLRSVYDEGLSEKVRLLEALVGLRHVIYGGVTGGVLHGGWGVRAVSPKERMRKCLFRMKSEGCALVHEYGEYD